MNTPVTAEHPNQFALLGQRRFGPFFWVQFLGAGNDNVFKFAFTVLVTYQLQVQWLPASRAGLVIGALFISPYLLFSATSGQLADKYPKEVLIRFVKSLEIAIMAVAGLGFMQQNVPLLLACVFLMGLHSTLFGPVKFLVCNHVSFVDAVLLMAASPRPIRFIMDHRIFATPVLGTLFRLGKAIPIAPHKDDPAAYERAFAQARRVLDDGELLCIFPEGGLTRDGELGQFKGGVMKILQTHPVPVVPMALSKLWGSFFSRVERGTAMVRPFRRGLFSPVGLTAGAALPAAQVTPAGLRERVAGLLAA